MMKDRQSLSQLVVKDNRLIQQARYNLTATQQKFLAYIISMIKPTDNELKEYSIRVDDFCDLIGTDKNHFYDEFKCMIEDFDNAKSFWVETDEEIFKFYWLSDARYIKGKGTLQVTLARTLREYLLQLSENFTQYELYNILALKSKYSIRLFELFKSYAYQHKREFDVDYLKELLFATNYTNFADFEKRVLKPAITEINEYTELSISYEKIKKGKKIEKIFFFIVRKKHLDGVLSYRRTIARLHEKKAKNEIMEGQTNLFD